MKYLKFLNKYSFGLLFTRTENHSKFTVFTCKQCFHLQKNCNFIVLSQCKKLVYNLAVVIGTNASYV